MSPSEAIKFNPDFSNIPSLRRESVSTMSFKFDKPRQEKENRKDEEILIILRKIQQENWNHERNNNEMKKEIRDMRKIIDNILDLNIKLEMELKTMKEEAQSRENRNTVNKKNNTITINENQQLEYIQNEQREKNKDNGARPKNREEMQIFKPNNERDQPAQITIVEN